MITSKIEGRMLVAGWQLDATIPAWIEEPAAGQPSPQDNAGYATHDVVHLLTKATFQRGVEQPVVGAHAKLLLKGAHCGRGRGHLGSPSVTGSVVTL